jgi:hypothetical protein
MDKYHQSWSESQRVFLKTCIAKHGHENLWGTNTPLKFQVSSLTGPLVFFKNIKKLFSSVIKVEIYPEKQKVLFYNSIDGCLIGTYERGNIEVTIGSEVKNSLRHGEKFGLLKKIKTWDTMDAIYFFGYAFVTYYSVPSILASLELIQEVSTQFHGETLRGFRVKFPDEFDTHCEEQTFFFNTVGLLIRHDYRADIIFPPAYGSHFTSNYFLSNQIQVAGNREVVMRVGEVVSPIMVLKAQIGPCS